MAYVTPAQLAENPGALELAQVASDPGSPVVDTDLMALTLRGGDRSAYTAPEIAAADAAALRIDQASDGADSLIDGYLGKRYPLPLANAPGLLAVWARAIVRYTLHKDRITDDRSDPVARDYRDAMKLLEQVAVGKFSLGLDDPTLTAGAAGEVQFTTGDKVFGRRVLP